MSQAAPKSAGRHTPMVLSLSAGGKASKSKNDNKTEDAEKAEPIVVAKTVRSSPKTITKSDAKNAAAAAAAAAVEEQKNGSATNGAHTKDANSDNKETNGATNEEKKVRESSRQRSGPAKVDIDESKNGGKEAKDDILTNQPSVVIDNLKPGKKTESEKKSDAKKTEPEKKSDTKKTESEKKSDTKKTESEKKSDTNKTTESRKSDVADNKKSEVEKKTEVIKPVETEKKDTSIPVSQNTKKTEIIWDDQDMEPLMMEVELDEFSGSARTPGRVLRMKSGAVPASTTRATAAIATRSSPLKNFTSYTERVQNNTSTMVNTSGVSEQSSSSSSVTSSDLKPTTPRRLTEESFSTRSISGRRTFRPLREMSFQTSYRDTYRQLNESTTSSLNATVGSEIHYDSLRTPLSKSARKRDRIDHVEHLEPLVNESPKRARMDIGGFIGFMVSPVTMLRDRLSRSRIQSSTPNKKLINNDDIMIDTVSASNIEDEKIVVDEDDEEVEALDNADIEAGISAAGELDNDDDETTDDIALAKLKQQQENNETDVIVADAEAALKKKTTCRLM